MGSAEETVYVLGNLGFLWTGKSFKPLTLDRILLSEPIVSIADIGSIFSLKVYIHHM